MAATVVALLVPLLGSDAGASTDPAHWQNVPLASWQVEGTGLASAVVGDTVYVGGGGRTNAEGIRQLRAILEPLGATVIAVPNTKALHLKSAVTALPDGTVVGHLPLVEDPRAFDRFLPVPEESGAHMVLLGGPRLLMASDCPQTHELYRGLGYEPVIIDLSEYQKLEGCVTCLSVRLRHLVS